ncbi:MAG: heavy metal-associated domain-containing protein [Planctomycetota bacterium]
MQRFIKAFFGAALVASGTFAQLGCSTSGGPETVSSSASGDASGGGSANGGLSAAGADSENAGDEAPRPPKDPNAKYQLVSVEVPTMSCPFACWPKVKKTLEKQAGVGDVTLAPQKEADAIDKPVVIVEATDAFQVEAAFAALTEAGFGGAKLAAATASPTSEETPSARAATP